MKSLEPLVLYREDKSDSEQAEEIEIIRSHFAPVVPFRSQCGEGKLVIGRYSVLPYYKELTEELELLGSRLINTLEMHRWIANFGYYDDLREFTFESWKSLSQTNYQGPFVLKGKTNSRKHQWNTHMFAETRADAIRVESELFNDSLIGPQGVIFRKYEPLKTFEVGINGMRFCNEFRFFFLRHHYLSHGYYWTTADQPELGYCSDKMFEFAKMVAHVASAFANFFVLDIAEKEDGDMVLVEVNDGQMSGLSMNNPVDLWTNLKSGLSQVELL